MQEIKDFIYLDMEKVSSLFSQLTGGIVQQEETSTVSSNNSKNLRNYDLKLFKHEAGGVKSESQKLTETRISHHDLYNELEESLYEHGYTAEIGVDVTEEQISSGEATDIFENALCIKAEGWAVLEDYERISRVANSHSSIVDFINKSIASNIKNNPEICEHVETIEEQKRLIKNMKNGQQKSKLKKSIEESEKIINNLIKAAQIKDVESWIIDGLRDWIQVFLPRIFNFRLYPFEKLDDFHILSNLKKESFIESDIESVHFLYGTKPTVKISMLGVITAIPHKDDEPFDPMGEFEKLDDDSLTESESVEKAFRGVFRGFDGLEEMIRTCRYPRIMVQPIAIYRSLKPNTKLKRINKA